MPMESHIKLTNTQSPLTGTEYASMQHISYHEVIESLMYTMLSMCLNISYAVSTVLCFTSNPGMPHWEAVHWIYRYLIGMKNLHLTYRGMRKPLHGYTDVDGSMAKDQKAILGYAFLIDSGAMSWASKKQEIILLLMTESEYIATIYWRSSHLFWQAHHPLLWQPIHYCACQEPSVSHVHQAHQHLFPFHTLDSQQWQNSTCVLPYKWHGHQHPYQGTPLTESQTFHSQTWTAHGLRGSVGICNHVCSHIAIRQTKLLMHTWCMSIPFLVYVSTLYEYIAHYAYLIFSLFLCTDFVKTLLLLLLSIQSSCIKVPCFLLNISVHCPYTMTECSL